MCLSDIALNSVTKEDHCKPIITEAYSNAMNHQWSSFVCLLALSSVVKLQIESYFPITHSESTLKENIDSLSTMFTALYPQEKQQHQLQMRKFVYLGVHYCTYQCFSPLGGRVGNPRGFDYNTCSRSRDFD